MEVIDDLGRSITVADPPRRLISLVPNLSEFVHRLGRSEDLVGVTEYCVEPPDGFPVAKRLRGTKNPDTATIVGLTPDLVLANDEENRKHDVDRLQAAGIAVYVTKVRTVTDVPDVIARLAAVLGCGQQGAAMAEQIRSLAPAAQSDGPRVFCPIWRDGSRHGQSETWWCVGPDTYAGALLRDAGFTLVAGADDPRYPRLTAAEVKAAQPDLVLLPDEPYPFTAADAAVFRDWPGTTVLPYPGTDLFWWGPRTAQARQTLHALR